MVGQVSRSRPAIPSGRAVPRSEAAAGSLGSRFREEHLEVFQMQSRNKKKSVVEMVSMSQRGSFANLRCHI